MVLRNHDANTETASSTGSTAASANAEVVKSGVESTSIQAATETAAQPTLESVLQDKFKELSSQDKPEAEKEEESLVRLSNETEKKEDVAKSTEEKEASKTEEAKEETQDKEEDKGPIPYDRFQEVNTAKVKLQEQLESQKEIVQAQQQIVDYCQRNQISPEEFQNWMEVAALAKTNPEVALQKLSPLVEGLKSYTGDALSKELQDDVDAGIIPLEYAKRLAKAENQRKFGEKQQQMTQQQMLQQQQGQYVAEMQRTLSSWMDGKKGSDPDFAPKAKPEMPHGKFEHFLNEFAVQVKNAKVEKVSDLVFVAEKAYATIDASFKSFAPKRNGTTHVTSTKSSTTKTSKPGTVEEAIAARAAMHGLNVPASLTRR